MNHLVIKSPCNRVQCGINAKCKIDNEIASCVCEDGFSGDPSIECCEYFFDLV